MDKMALPGIEAPRSTGSPAMPDFDAFFRMTMGQRISDVHLRVGYPPVLRRDGIMFVTKSAPLTTQDMDHLYDYLLSPRLKQIASNREDFDFGAHIEGVGRFRVNLFYSQGERAFVIRLIPSSPLTIDDLGLPGFVKNFLTHTQGLLLITGATGSGKSTTLASMIHHINLNHPKHIVTLEDPIEFVHKNLQAIVTQREVGKDTASFPSGIKYALRQDPDIILIGEMRDRETIMSAIESAETGHFVLSTLHTNDCVQTINRIINAFEPHEREPIRIQLGHVLQGTISQKLVRRADGKGRMAVAEVMTVSPAIRDYILRNEIPGIYELMNQADFDGMVSMNVSLYKAYKNKLITLEEALAVSNNSDELRQMLRGAFHGSQEFQA